MRGRSGRDLPIKTVHMRHNHTNAARTDPSPDGAWLWRAMNSKISVAIAVKQVESARTQRVIWPSVHAISVTGIQTGVALHHGRSWCPGRPSGLTTDRI